jgi:RNA-directed DNA polymerase
LLLNSWRLLRNDAALGVDRVSAAEYEASLAENIQQLVERLKRKSYRAKLVRRHYIPKGNGGVRPLRIPATEDKLLQLAVKRLLEAIYEQDFLACSYGYRPLVRARTAVDELRVKLQFGGYHHLVEADIKGFFDNLSHEWLVRMLAERIDDEPFLRLIKKWLKAGAITFAKSSTETSRLLVSAMAFSVAACLPSDFLRLFLVRHEKSHRVHPFCIGALVSDPAAAPLVSLRI